MPARSCRPFCSCHSQRVSPGYLSAGLRYTTIRGFEEGEEDRTPSIKRFGFVQTLDTKSKRRLYEVLHSQDFQMNQEITFLSDGEDTLRQLQLGMSPKA